MTYSIKHLLHIEATQEKVFKTIFTTEGIKEWWSTDVEGESILNALIRVRFGSVGPDMKIIDVIPNKKLVWQCMNDDGWFNHIFIFSLDQNDGKTRVSFSHEGWDNADDFYASCSFSWGRYLESLRQYCQIGKGAAFGGDNYKS